MLIKFNEHSHSTRSQGHFKDWGYSLHHMEIVAIEIVRNTDPWIWLAREKLLLIHTFDATLKKIMLFDFILFFEQLCTFETI